MKYLFLAVYAAAMILIAVFTHRKSNNVNDFFLGGRNIGPWLSAFAYGTSYFSAVIFVGYAGKNGWNAGLSAVWIGIGNAVIGSLLAWAVLAKPARRMTQRLSSSTMPEFFRARFDSKWMKIVSAIVIFVFLVPYSASVYQGLGYMFEQIYGIPFLYCMILMAALTALYLIAGGYLATAIGDLVQGVIMLVGVGLMMFFLFRSMGGPQEALTRLAQTGENMANLFSSGEMSPRALICMIILTSLGPWGLPQMVHKFYAIKDEKAIRRGTLISTLFALIIGGSAYGAGAFSRVVLNGTLPQAVTTASSMDLVMPTVLFQTMPQILLGLIMVLILSASMSTLASLVLTSASTVAMDLGGIFFPKWTQKQTMTVLRVMCVVFVGASLWISISNHSGIVTLMSLSWGTVAGTCLGPFLFGLTWRGTTKAGAWAGMLGGLLTSLVLTAMLGMAESPLCGTCAMFASIALTYVVSLFTKKPDAALVRTAFGD